MLLKHQETIKFDPSKKEHRAAVAAFLKRRAWSDSPFRFAYDPDYGSVAEQVQAKLLDWYLQKEATKLSSISVKLQHTAPAARTIQSAGVLPATFFTPTP